MKTYRDGDYLTAKQAKELAHAWSIPVPRVGYEVEVKVDRGKWILRSTGHFQFGWFGSYAPKPFYLSYVCQACTGFSCRCVRKVTV